MAGCSIITYKGKEIIYGDHQELSGDELLQNIKRVIKTVKDYKKPEVLFLGNFTNTYASTEVMNYLKSSEVIAINKKYTKMAVFGIMGIKKIMLKAFNAVTGDKTKLFSTEDEAKEYLVK